MSLSKKNFKFTFIIGGVATGFGVLYLLYNNYQNSRLNLYDIPREITIRILKELRKDLYPIFKKILKASKSMRMAASQQRKMNRSMANDPMASFDKIELCEIPEFKEMILSVQERIYSKYNIENKDIFEKFCVKLQKTDVEINKIMTEISDMYLQAKKGDIISMDFAVPDQILEFSVLNAQKELHQETLRALKQDIQNSIEGNMSTEQSMRTIQKNIDNAHEFIYKHNGFDIMEDFHPESVFEQAYNKFFKTSIEFKKKIQLLDVHFNNIVNQLVRGRKSLESLEEDIEQMDKLINPVKNELVIDYIQETERKEEKREIEEKPTEIEVISLNKLENIEGEEDKMEILEEIKENTELKNEKEDLENDQINKNIDQNLTELKEDYSNLENQDYFTPADETKFINDSEKIEENQEHDKNNSDIADYPYY